jgi:hypothetical protein
VAALDLAVDERARKARLLSGLARRKIPCHLGLVRCGRIGLASGLSSLPAAAATAGGCFWAGLPPRSSTCWAIAVPPSAGVELRGASLERRFGLSRGATAMGGSWPVGNKVPLPLERGIGPKPAPPGVPAPEAVFLGSCGTTGAWGARGSPRPGRGGLSQAPGASQQLPELRRRSEMIPPARSSRHPLSTHPQAETTGTARASTDARPCHPRLAPPTPCQGPSRIPAGGQIIPHGCSGLRGRG